MSYRSMVERFDAWVCRRDLRKYVGSKYSRRGAMSFLYQEMDEYYSEDNKYEHVYLMVNDLLAGVDIRDMDPAALKGGLCAEVDLVLEEMKDAPRTLSNIST